MDFNKNTVLIQNICLVQIRSVDDVIDIPALKTVYATLSKISLTGNSKNTNAGILTSKRLTLTYPGISTTDFNKFQSLVRGAYQVYVKTTENDIYEVASVPFFMTCTTSFDNFNNHQLVFSSNSPEPIKFIENQEPIGILIDGFNYDLDFNLS